MAHFDSYYNYRSAVMLKTYIPVGTTINDTGIDSNFQVNDWISFVELAEKIKNKEILDLSKDNYDLLDKFNASNFAYFDKENKFFISINKNDTKSYEIKEINKNMEINTPKTRILFLSNKSIPCDKEGFEKLLDSKFQKDKDEK